MCCAVASDLFCHWCWWRQPKPFALYYSLTELQTAPSAQKGREYVPDACWWCSGNEIIRRVGLSSVRVELITFFIFFFSFLFLSRFVVFILWDHEEKRKKGGSRQGREREKRRPIESYISDSRDDCSRHCQHISFFYWTQHSGDH